MEDIYVEYRKWVFWWGMNVDSQIEINEILQNMNRRGYRLVAYHWHNGIFPNIPAAKLAFIHLASLCTFGFASYYVGPHFIFTKSIAGGLGGGASGKALPTTSRRIDDAAADWSCPQCRARNPNSTYSCAACSYSLL